MAYLTHAKILLAFASIISKSIRPWVALNEGDCVTIVPDHEDFTAAKAVKTCLIPKRRRFFDQCFRLMEQNPGKKPVIPQGLALPQAVALQPLCKLG